MKKIIVFLLTICILTTAFILPTNAAELFVPYDTYEYNNFEEAVDAPVGFCLSETIDSAHLGLEKSLNYITDMVFRDGIIYILDSGNSRILALSTDYQVINIFSNFYYTNENLSSVLGTGEIVFKNAQGFTIAPNGNFYIADTSNNRVLNVTRAGEIVSVITRPDEALNYTNAAFSPKKIEIDEENRIYIASSQIAQGVMVFDANENFLQFFGANQVLSKSQSLERAFRKVFMTVAQLELVEQSTPVTIRSMDFSSDGFLYTVSPYRNPGAKAAVPELVRKLNYKGNNILDAEVVFGDLEEDKEDKTWFQDIDIDDRGFINLLDENRGRIFQYTDSGMLISVFGSKGDQNGCFTFPTSIESINQDIIVSDKDKNCIFVYSPTEYVKTLRSAVTKMENNDLEGSIEEWNTLIKMNSNSYFAYEGMARICDYQGDYKEAMRYFKLAQDQEGYALSYQQYRQELIEKYSLLIIFIVAAFVVGISILFKKLKKYTVPIADSAYSKMEQKYTMPFYILLHPIDGCSQFKLRKIASLPFSIGIVIAWVIIRILNYSFTGFAFNINRSIDFNLLVELVLSVGVFTSFVIANWFVSILFEGKGAMHDIIATTAYSLIPYLVSRILKVVLTNVLVPSESIFISIISVIGIAWTVAVLFTGLMTIHEYSVGRTIASIVFTLLGIVIIVFLVILLYSLLMQLVNFIKSVYQEFIFRL